MIKYLGLKNLIIVSSVFFSIVILVIIFSSVAVFSAPDNILNYQGKLTDTSDISVPDGNFDFKFTIWDAETSGNCLWSARGSCGTPTAKTIAVENGIFSTKLGETGDNALTLDFNSNYWLEVQVEADSPMTPRKMITAAGFAINSSRLNGQQSDYFLNTSAGSQVKAGDLTIEGDLTVSELLTSSGDLVLNPTGSYVNLAGSSLRFDYAGSLLDRIEPSSINNYLDFYTDTTSSGIRFNTSSGQDFLVTGGDVGIGTSSPNSKLEILSTGEQLRLSYDATTFNTFQTDASGNLTITTTGEFTFSGGTLNAPTFAGDGSFGDLSVTGNISFPTDSLEISDIDWVAGEIVLHAEYPGAVLSGDGSSNIGTMTSDNEGSGSNRQNYYEWYSSESSLNDYDVRVRFTLPPDFDTWGTDAIIIDYATASTSIADNKLDISVYLESSASSDVDDNDNVSSVASTWTYTTIADSSLTDCNAAGETCEIILRMFSKDSSYVRVGDITLNYNRP